MTDRRHPKHKDEPAGADQQAADSTEGAAASEEHVQATDQSPADELEALERKLRDAEAMSAENLDGWQRSLAEFQNYKKRIERDREAEQEMMKGDLIKKVLPVLDDLERALQNRPADDAWTNGIELIQRKLAAILESEGVKRIEAEGAVFDPNFHEAISQEPVDGTESGRIISVVQNGYMLGERVIRPAMVRVAK
jgi:molecular chaperone GrpE